MIQCYRRDEPVDLILPGGHNALGQGDHVLAQVRSSSSIQARQAWSSP